MGSDSIDSSENICVTCGVGQGSSGCSIGCTGSGIQGLRNAVSRNDRTQIEGNFGGGGNRRWPVAGLFYRRSETEKMDPTVTGFLIHRMDRALILPGIDVLRLTPV